VLEKVIENWLTNSTEREFEIPFRQMLVSKGKRIIHVSSHGPYELGKDLYAFGSGRRLEAYQLKSGPVTQSVWDSIRYEVERLVTVPIDHPAVGRRQADAVYLVSNGEFSEPVIHEVNLLNSKWEEKGEPHLTLVSGSDLLSQLTTAQSTVLPQTPTDLHEFLKFYLSDGRSNLDSKGLASIVAGLLNYEQPPKSGAEAVRRIAGMVLFATYAMRAHSRVMNSIALADGWTIVASHILAFAELYKLPVPRWEPSFRLASGAAIQALQSLAAELLTRSDFTEGDVRFEGEFERMRITIASGRIAALHLAKGLLRETYEQEANVPEFLRKIEGKLSFWGEAMVPGSFCIALSQLAARHPDYSERLIQRMISRIALVNHSHSEQGLPCPYFDSDRAWRLSRRLGATIDEENESFAGQSYALKALTLAAARLGLRQVLEPLWRKITHVSYAEFVPDQPWMEFLWTCDRGEVMSRFPKRTQSWRQLQSESYEATRRLPSVLRGREWFLPMFLQAYPHRFKWSTCSLLLEALGV
jgi:hypothetical protein